MFFFLFGLGFLRIFGCFFLVLWRSKILARGGMTQIGKFFSLDMASSIDVIYVEATLFEHKKSSQIGFPPIDRLATSTIGLILVGWNIDIGILKRGPYGT